MTDSGSYLDFSGSGMTAGYNFLDESDLISPVSSLVFENAETHELTEKLKGLSGFEKVAYTNSGTEACDMALSRFGPPVVALEGSYHGRTFLAFKSSNGVGIDRENRILHLSVPSDNRSKAVVFEYNLKLLQKANKLFGIKGSPIIIELIQSDGGMRMLDIDFIEHMRRLTELFKLRLVIDEVYTGMGRSGELLLFKKFDMSPEMILIGKGMAAGLPMGAVLYSGKWDLPYGSALGMLGGNAMCSHAALKTIAALTEERLNFVRMEGLKIIDALRSAGKSKFTEVRGRGFMIGVEFKNGSGLPMTKMAHDVRNELLRRRVVCSLVGQHNNVLKITPPVMIDRRTLWTGVDIITGVLKDRK